MLFSQINPYIRYARILSLNKNSHYDNVIPVDARLFYTFSGYGKINVKNKEYEMSASSLIIINSGTPYKIITPENYVKYIAINFDYTQNANTYSTPTAPVLSDIFKEEMLLDYCTFYDEPQLCDALYIKQIPSLGKILNTIVNEYTQKLLYYESKISHLLAQSLSDVMRFSHIGHTDTQKENANRIISYIHENFCKNSHVFIQSPV